MLDIQVGLMVFVFVLFLSMLFMLNSWLFKPLLSFMDNRKNSMNSDVSEVQANENDAKNILRECEEVIAKSKKETSLAIERAIEAKKVEIASKVQDVQKKLDGEYHIFIQGLNKEKIELSELLMSKNSLYIEAINSKFVS